MVWPTPTDNKMKNFNMMDLPGHMLDAEFAPNTYEHMINLDPNVELACCRLTGIWATLGKSTYSVEIIEKMIEAGMDIAILNMTFGTTEEYLQLIRMARQAAHNYGTKNGATYPLAIGIILSGKKIRTGKCSAIYEDKIPLNENGTVRITTDVTFKDRCSAQTIFVDYPDFANQLEKGDEIVLDNDEILLLVEHVSTTTVTCKVERAGILGSYKDVYIPRRCINMPHFNQNDIQHIAMVLQHKLDIIILPFVNNANPIVKLKNMLGDKDNRIKIVANVQTVQGYKNFNKILEVADGVFISRLQLGLDIGAAKLIIAQKNMVMRANMANVPVIIANHLMSSMRFGSTPTKGDEIDVGNCVLDGVDGFYLSSETAVGRNPVETIENLARACKEAEVCMWSKEIFNEIASRTGRSYNRTMAVSIGAVLAAQRSLATVIFVSTITGNTAQLVAKFRPRCPIIAIMHSAHHCRAQQMYRGIVPLLYNLDEKASTHRDWHVHLSRQQEFAIKWAYKQGLVRKDDPVVSVFGRHYGVGNTNAFRVSYINVSDEEETEKPSCA